MRLKVKLFLITGLLFLSIFSTRGQQESRGNAPKVHAKMTPDTILIGDKFSLEVTVDKDLTQIVDFVEFENNRMGEIIEILDVSGIDTIAKNGRNLTLKRTYILTCFDAGNYSLGKMPMLYIDKNIVDTLFSEEDMLIFVKTFDIDTTKQSIVDIKKPIDTPLVFAEIKDYVYIGLAVIVIIALLVWLYLRYRKRKRDRIILRNQPPHIIAIMELEKIQNEKLWQNGKHKIYYTRIADVVRAYLEERYGINAMEMTSDEIMHAIKKQNLSDTNNKRMSELLSLADLVKFAKLVPGAEDNQQQFNNAYYFVEDTKPMPTEEESNNKQATAQELK